MVLPVPFEGPAPRTIAEGDLVIVYESFTSIKAVYIDSKATYTSRFGNFPHKVRRRRAMGPGGAPAQQPPRRGVLRSAAPLAPVAAAARRALVQRRRCLPANRRINGMLHPAAAPQDWVGSPYGSKSFSRPPGRGWVQLLAPSAELWTLVLRHRTQILYIADISLVVSHLDLKPGAFVLESGTGSASLTHSLARAVAPGGRVRSFEFHELRAKEAAAELARNGLPPTLASCELRNIEEKGFPADELAGTVDGIFLDLPGPWKVVPSAAACLKPNGRFCSFSPCIEQVRTRAWRRSLPDGTNPWLAVVASWQPSQVVLAADACSQTCRVYTHRALTRRCAALPPLPHTPGPAHLRAARPQRHDGHSDVRGAAAQLRSQQ